MDALDFFLLFGGQSNRLGHLGVAQCRGPALLQHNLLEPLGLAFVQDSPHDRVVGLELFLQLRATFLLVKIA